MHEEEVREVLAVNDILHDYDNYGERAQVISALIAWKRGGQFDINLSLSNEGPSEATVTPRGKRGKATEVPDDDDPPEPEF